MYRKKISVIMGVYNSNYDLLKKSIESILNQTYANFEFIICDDCSTNDVKKVIQEYQEKDSRIIYLKNDHNRGLAYSLNRCIDTSSGNYIARQDDDDISLETRFEKQVSFLNTNPQYDFVGCNHFLKDEGGIWGETKLISSPQKKDLLFGTPFSHPTIMVRKEAYEKVNGYRVLKRTRRTEDYDLYLRLYAKGSVGYNLQENLFVYTQSLETCSKRRFKHRIDECFCRFEGFKNLNMLLVGFPYIFKPIIAGMVPNNIKQSKLKKKLKIKRENL